MMLTTIILFTLIIMAITGLNVILTKEAIDRELTFSEIISENQDTLIGKILMGACSIPCYIILKIKSLRPINTKSCFDDDNPYNLQYYTLADILSLNPSTKPNKIIITPKNYYDILKYAKIANDNKDVVITIFNETVNEDYLNDVTFYGVRIGVVYKNIRSTGVTRYAISCYNAIRPEVK